MLGLNENNNEATMFRQKALTSEMLNIVKRWTLNIGIEKNKDVLPMFKFRQKAAL